MSVLAPLYLLGALAVAAPLIFHLIRRRVQQRTPVSFIQFLPITEPALRRRSRIENWLLLLLRAVALLLLALAFSRPFLRQAATIQTATAPRQVVVLVDTSASMQREDLGNQARQQLLATVRELGPDDSLAIITFDDSPRLLISFDAFQQLSPQARRSIDAGLLDELSPSWRHTNLAAALQFAADYAHRGDGQATAASRSAITPDTVETADTATVADKVPTQLVLISDLQSGADLDSLQAVGWPDDLPVQLRRVTAQQPTNAWLTLPPPDSQWDQDQRFRLRLHSTTASAASRVQVRWQTAADWTPQSQPSGSQPSGYQPPPSPSSSDPSGEPAAAGPAVDLPPGQSRLLPIPPPPEQVLAVAVAGDQHPFDNRRYYVQPQPQQQTLGVFGPIADQPQDRLSYYLQRLPLDNAQRTVEVVVEPSPPATLDAASTPLIVVCGNIDQAAAERYHEFLRGGGRLLYVLLPLTDSITADQLTASLRRLSQSPAAPADQAADWQVQEAGGGDYAILAQVDLGHPLLAAFADPQFADFSKIRFWAHRRLQPPNKGWRTIAAFDDGSPALLEQLTDEHPGRLWLLTAGWQPSDSQLALSTKFLPLVFEMFDTPTVAYAGPSVVQAYPGQSLAELLETGDQPLQIDVVADADGARRPLDEDTPRSEESRGRLETQRNGEQRQTLQRPGVYRVRWGDQQRTVVVNLAESESQTDPLDDDALERASIRLGQLTPPAVAEATQRQLRDLELEGQQRIWQWLLIGVLGLLVLETAIGTKRMRKQA